jgi:predicted small secreted protein
LKQKCGAARLTGCPAFIFSKGKTAMTITNLKKFALCLCLLGTLAVSACNTTEGAGKDIEAAGDTIKDAARDNKSY